MSDTTITNPQVAQLFEDFYAQEAGSGGVICQATISFGYKVFAPGFRANEAEKTFFAMRPVGKGQDPTPEQEAIQAAYKAFAAENNNSNSNFGVMIRSYLETAARGNGKPVNWKCDQFDFVSGYTDACKQVVLPSLYDTDIAIEMVATGSWTGYVRLGWKDDPHFVAQGDAGKQDVDQDGAPRYAQVLYITERFANESAAREAIGLEDDVPTTSATTQSHHPDIPSGYAGDEAAWRSVWEEMYNAKQDGMKLPDLVKNYSADNVAQVTKALNAYIPI